MYICYTLHFESSPYPFARLRKKLFVSHMHTSIDPEKTLSWQKINHVVHNNRYYYLETSFLLVFNDIIFLLLYLLDKHMVVRASNADTNIAKEMLLRRIPRKGLS